MPKSDTAGNGNRQSSDERTPLLKQQKDRRSNEQDSSDGRNSDAHSSTSSENSDSIVSNLGDFALQPSDIAQAIKDKDEDRLLEIIGNDDIFKALQSDATSGLQSDQVSEDGRSERIRVYGRNQLPERQLKPFYKFLWDAFNDKVLIILTVAAAVSFSLGLYQDYGPNHDPEQPRVNWIEGVAIMTAIVIVTLTSSINDYSKERQFKALSETKEIPEVKVLRDGEKYKVIKSTEVMVGDVLHIEAGDILSCDALLVAPRCGVKVDESDATGESDAIEKRAFKGTDVAEVASIAEDSDSDDKHKNVSSSTSDTKEDERGQDHSRRDGGPDDDDNAEGGEEEGDPFLLSGSKVLEGTGHCVVLAVGKRSFQGKIFMDLRSSQPDQTRMQKQLAQLAERIAKIASIAGALLFTILFVRNCVQLRTQPDRSTAVKIQGFIQSFVISVTLVVVAVPEGLPLAVTLALAFATKRMTKANLLVRVFEACETMSNANVVVTDKTGTLTANEMRVVEGTIGGTAFTLRSKEDAKAAELSPDEQDGQSDQGADESADPGPDDASDLVDEAKSKDELAKLFEGNKALKTILDEAIAINSTAFERSDSEEKEETQSKDRGNKGKKASEATQNGNSQHDDDNKDEEGVNFVGNKTETALLRMIHHDFSDQTEKSYKTIREEAETVYMVPFSSDRKAMATCLKVKDSKKYRLHIKGAAEVIVGLCTKRAKLESNAARSGENEEAVADDIDENEQKKIQQLINKYASRSLRTIALAYKDFDEWPPAQSGKDIKYEDIAKDLTLLAIPGIEDPLREGVKQAVEKCQTAGVHVIMCTGDNLLTAKAIAKQCGIFDGGEVISGKDWRALSDEEKREKAPKLQVMARSLPQDKQSLVKSLQDAGQIVGVTGDGTNDALALKDGDVGFAMGQAGTEVAKEAGDVIIMDDNFTSLVGAIAWGRCVSDAVRKFLQFQLAVNVTAIVITFVSSVTGGDESSVMNAVQLLWVNLIMDTFAALALATDPADESLLQRKPEPRSTPIIRVPMTKMIIFEAAYQIGITLALHFTGPRILSPFVNDQVTETQFKTVVFNTFVWCQIFNLINCRQLMNHLNVVQGLHRNLWMLSILVIMIGGQILIVFFGGAAFETEPIPAQFWLISIVIGAGSLVVGLIARLLPDKPLEAVLRALRVYDDKTQNLPQDSPRAEAHRTKESKSELEKAASTFIERVRGGRHKASTELYTWLRQDAPSERSRSVIKGLFVLPAVAAVAISKGNGQSKRTQR